MNDIVFIMLLSFFLSVFIPDMYIPDLIGLYRKKIGIGREENSEWFFLPTQLGWIERALTWIVWFFLQSQFIAFLGVWFAFKVIGNYPGSSKIAEHHEGRARFIVFMIGTSLSVLSVIVIALFTQLFFIPGI